MLVLIQAVIVLWWHVDVGSAVWQKTMHYDASGKGDVLE